jgi:endoglucanase
MHDQQAVLRRRCPAPITGSRTAAAAAAQSAGNPQARDALLADPQAINGRFPTYYGAAWIAIARVELSSSVLGGCG